MGGYLKVIDAPVHPDSQQVARNICPEAITNNVLRTALDLQRGGDHDVDIPPAAKLKEYFGEYSASGKAYRTYGGPNKVFGEIARILMEYAFVHTNPTSMPQNKAAVIISAYEGHRIDWGIITGEGLRAAIASFQSGKKMLSVVTHFLMVLFPPASLSSPRKLTSPPPPRRQREKVLAISHEAWEAPTPPSPPASDQHHHLLKPNRKGPYPRPAKNGRRRQIPRTTRPTTSPLDSQRRVPRSLPQSLAHAPPQSLAHAPPHSTQHPHETKNGSRRRQQHHQPRKPKPNRARKGDSTVSPQQNKREQRRSKLSLSARAAWPSSLWRRR